LHHAETSARRQSPIPLTPFRKHAVLGIADTAGRFEDRLQDVLQISGGRGDDAQHVGRGRLPLQRRRQLRPGLLALVAARRKLAVARHERLVQTRNLRPKLLQLVARAVAAVGPHPVVPPSRAGAATSAPRGSRSSQRSGQGLRLAALADDGGTIVRPTTPVKRMRPHRDQSEAGPTIMM
jgi:hypothetical protein